MEKKAPRVRRPKISVPLVQEDAAVPQAGASFPIVGLGASAGGFEALEQFMKHVPPECGMAFVVVQHLDPTRKGLMAELLQRCTRMKVVQVKDRTRVRPDCVAMTERNTELAFWSRIARGCVRTASM